MKSFSIIPSAAVCLLLAASHQAFATPSVQVSSVSPSNVNVGNTFTVSASGTATNGATDPQVQVEIGLKSNAADGTLDCDYFAQQPLSPNQTLTLTPFVGVATSITGTHYVTAEFDLSSGQFSSLGSSYTVGAISDPGGPGVPVGPGE